MKILLLILGVAALASAGEIGKRNVIQFASMYSKTVGLGYFQAVNEYMGYGCFCGVGGGGTPVDETDQCCVVHDECYKHANSNGCSGLDRYAITYDYEAKQGSDGKYQLTCKAEADYDSDDDSAQCKAYMCNCDRVGSECFAKTRPTFKPKYVRWPNLFCW